MPRLNGRTPAYRLHRASGQALVTLGGRDYYLGPHGTNVSKAEYDRVVTEWLTNGRRLPAASPTAAVAASDAISGEATIEHVIYPFWEFAQMHYRRPDGTPTSEVDNIRQALRPLRRLYGRTPAAAFGPLSLKALREHMITLGWCRTNINNHVSRIKSLFRWAAENELVPPAVYHGLLAVRGLQRGRTTAPEPSPVRPVPEHMVEAVKPFVSRQVWALIRLQLLTGARPGELVALRSVDLSTGGDVWLAVPEHHKTVHHGHTKRIYFGPQAQAILKEFIDGRAVDAFLFSPAEAEAERRAAAHAARRTPMSCGNRPGSTCRGGGSRAVGERYTVDSYRRAIERACDAAFPLPPELERCRLDRTDRKRGTRWETDAEWRNRLGAERWQQLRDWRASHRWHPHQLRHNAGTHLRREFGIEVARIILGHRSAAMTEVYAEMDDEKAKAAVQKVG